MSPSRSSCGARPERRLRIVAAVLAALALYAGGPVAVAAVPPASHHDQQSGRRLYYWRGADMRPISAAAAGVSGMRVERVKAGSPALHAGLRPGDIVVALDGMPIGSARSLAFAIADHRGGSTVRLELLRGHRERYVELAGGASRQR
jgi:S1-C subfamily serine protease